VTTPTDIQTPATEAPGEEGGLQLRRILRTASSESWDLVDGDDRIGTVTLQYGDDSVEGVLALPAGADGEAVRGILGWVSELLVLDQAAGPGGVIHWVVSTGELEDFWRRSPGRRPTGAENDLGATRARVEQVLTAMFGQVNELEDGGYAVDAGSVRVFVVPRLVEGSVLVRVFSITNLDVPLDGDLPAFLLGLNFSMGVGRFSVDANHRAVWFDHVLGVDELADAVLARTVAVVAQTADRFDDEIKTRYGGRTFREEGSPVEAAKLEPGMAGGYL
jgi:hypothetical protein